MATDLINHTGQRSIWSIKSNGAARIKPSKVWPKAIQHGREWKLILHATAVAHRWQVIADSLKFLENHENDQG